MTFSDQYASMMVPDYDGIPTCKGCGKHPHDLSDYKYEMASNQEEFDALTDHEVDEYARHGEGTYNRETGYFWCNGCYIKAGMPLGVA